MKPSWTYLQDSSHEEYSHGSFDSVAQWTPMMTSNGCGDDLETFGCHEVRTVGYRLAYPHRPIDPKLT
jgi:hypothetical protein